MKQNPFSAVLFFAMSVVVGLGPVACKRDELPVLRGSAPSPESHQQLLDPSLPAGHPPINAANQLNPHGGEMPALPPPAAPGPAETLAWELPKGWTEARSGGMRLATLKPPVPGKVDVSVIVLPGTAGGELGNVNRWRGQIGLPPVDEAGLEKLRKQVKSKAGEVSLYDLTGQQTPPQRMLAGLLLVDERSWFLKMTGDADAVGAARADFVKLLESLHRPADK